jgi:thymidylate synthase ThyX
MSNLKESANTNETLHINFENDEVQASFNLKDLNFADLDQWVRSRFGLVNSESLRYMNKLGEGIKEC